MSLIDTFRGEVRLARFVAVVAVLVSVACGGGGGGGGGGPTTPPPVVTGNLRGTVVGFVDPGTNFAGTVVEVVGVASTSVNSANAWGIDNVPEGVQRLRITGPNHISREISVRISGGTTNSLVNLDLVEAGVFNLAAFNEIYRSFSIPGTIRWNRRPRRVLLDRNSLGSLPQGFDFFEREVRRAYRTWLPRNTNEFFAGTPVESGSIEPLDVDDFSCDDVEDGDLVIVGIDECPIEDDYIILGTTTHCFDTNDNEVILGAIWFNPCTNVATIEHEIIHTLCSGHLESNPNRSIMGSPGGSGEILPMDRLHMRYVYSRPAGVVSPDNSVEQEVMEPDLQ